MRQFPGFWPFLCGAFDPCGLSVGWSPISRSHQGAWWSTYQWYIHSVLCLGLMDVQLQWILEAITRKDPPLVVALASKRVPACEKMMWTKGCSNRTCSEPLRCWKFQVNSVCFNAHTGAALVEHWPAVHATPKKRKAEEAERNSPETHWTSLDALRSPRYTGINYKVSIYH